ncbi:MAG: hypothetical protein AB7L09_01025 [Nitrospira sp.]
MPGVYPNGQEPKQINDELDEWVTVIDPATMQPRRVKKNSVLLHEVRPGVTAAQPRRPLTED